MRQNPLRQRPPAAYGAAYAILRLALGRVGSIRHAPAVFKDGADSLAAT